jgi:hypothetical protein
LKKRTSINSIPKIHKEKEMADFRKWLYALAVVALLAGLTIPASAQSTVTCGLQTATNNLVRAEGYTEQVGDVVLACTGGVPTAAGSAVQPVNIQIFLSQNVTSRITASTGSGVFVESLLIIDEPNSFQNNGANANIPILNCGAPGAPDGGVNALGSGPGVCSIIAPALVGASSPNTYNGTAGHPNVFQGRLAQSGTNSIVFQGVPFDPPGTATRFLRITNVRANANGAGIAQANQTSLITMGISSSGSSSLQISIASQAVATVQRGLITSTLYSNTTFAQCVDQSKGLLTASTEPAFGATGSSSSATGFDTSIAKTPTIRFQEGFNSSWKVKNVAHTLANGTLLGSSYVYTPPVTVGGVTTPSPINYPTDLNQNVPGVSYNTESGFEFYSATANPSPNPPPGFQTFGTSATTTVGGTNVFSDSNTGIVNAGIANQGTRLAAALANVPNGLSVYVSPVIFLYRLGNTYTNPAQNNGTATGVMVLTNTASDGSGTYNPPSGITTANEPLQLVSVTNGAALVVYEILFADPFSVEYADVPFVVAYASALSSNAPIGLPQPGVIATYTAGFAPFYSTAAATLASGSLPIPRFVFTGAAANLFGVVKCSCNLLFPYVTQAPGYDTGIAVANTTADPYGTTNQFGAVQFWYYGSLTNGGAAPGTQCTNTASPGTCPGTTYVAAGQVLTYTLYNGSAQWGLDNRGAGFTGYMIAQTQFQFCHAFAFIGGLGGGPAVNSSTNGLSEGYLALVLDGAIAARTGVANETLGQ